MEGVKKIMIAYFGVFFTWTFNLTLGEVNDILSLLSTVFIFFFTIRKLKQNKHNKRDKL